MNNKRYTMIGLMLSALLLCYIDRIIVSLAAIEMQNEFGWTDSQKGLVLSSFFAGYLLTQALGGILSYRFGGRNVFLVAVLLWSLFTVLVPALAYVSFGALIFARIMLGVGEGASFPSAYNLIHAWMPERERSRSVGAMSAASAVGTVATLLTAGIIIEKYGWPSVFYLFGSMGFIWAFFWRRNVPAQAEPIPGGEAAPQRKSIPWRILATHPAVWTIYVASICVGSISFVLASWLPSYFVDTFDASLTQAGLYSVLPWITVAISTMAGGNFADQRIGKTDSKIRVRKQVTVAGLTTIIISCVALLFVPSVMVAVLVICVLFAGVGVAVVGYSPTAAELLPDHGDVFYGIAAACGSIGAMFAVTAIGYLLEDTGSYDLMFLGISAACVITALIYLAFGRADSLMTGEQDD
ncbi:MAG: MFS transporter [Woeseiaceae bacterium]